MYSALRTKLFLSLTVYLAAILGLAPMSSAQTVYTSQASFTAATSGITTIEFEGIAPNGYLLEAAGSLSISGVTFSIDRTQSNGNLFVIGQNYYYVGDSVLSSQESTTGNNNLVVTLPPNTTAVGFEIGDFGETPISVILSDGSSFSVSPPGFPNLTFWGVTAATPITALRLTVATTDIINLDNFQFETSAGSGPSITSTLPSSAIQGGKISLFLINGANFQTEASISFSGGQDIAITGTWISATQIALNLSIAASAAPGTHSVTVTNPDRQYAVFPSALNVITIPPQPQGLYAVDGNQTVYLSWSGAQSAPEGYNVYVNGVKANTSGLVQDTSFVADNLQNGQTYQLGVTAVGGGGESNPTTLSVVPNPFYAPAHPVHQILFLHGIHADATAWETTADFLTGTLGWTCGGTLVYAPSDDPRTKLPHPATSSDPSPSPCRSIFNTSADYFTTDFGDPLANYTNDPDSTGIFRQGDEVGGFIREIYSTRKLSIVAWSMGGLAARSYMQVTDPIDAPNQISDVITLGTPHWGVDGNDFRVLVVARVLGLADTQGFADMNGGCAANGDYSATEELSRFLQALDLPSATPLPGNSRYVVISGTGGQLPYYNSACNEPQLKIPTDWAVPITSSTLADILPTSTHWSQLNTLDVHTESLPGTALADDVSSILCAIDNNCLAFTLRSPVTIRVTAPNGLAISNTFTSMPAADYRSLVNAEGHEIGTVLIPFPQPGQYTITVTPKPGAQPTDTFTITMTQDGTTTTLADQMQIQNIPPDGFHIMASGWIPIDIKPGEYPNSINPRSNGTIPVAILSTPSFDAPSTVMASSLNFGHDGTEASLAFCDSNGEDVNGDGLPDLVCHFYTQQTGFQQGDKQGILTGKTADGQLIQGVDTVNIVQ